MPFLRKKKNFHVEQLFTEVQLNNYFSIYYKDTEK